MPIPKFDFKGQAIISSIQYPRDRKYTKDDLDALDIYNYSEIYNDKNEEEIIYIEITNRKLKINDKEANFKILKM
jgi:hypothetical protein